ncbi:TetR family transcriptional regulator [Frankia sp. CNm7]|uniref:TetR family transcriptional regulator n=1 Tax=Frankia nepalensis TaxID=1836974 RepID=A0A937RDJ9_9ACTN|nr:TetR family transcriptional regulator [Frankia nepalensis]MBL7501782.1 TetR family transcriptional regulator [Frankia nepalensis]MBL7515508.1 TetR family transcriptional regulator [Frankia nepalensis]MBL7523274.1 TetR family transcriptional regulator [Frankia nepalensis]MBL7628282.1 TetR family transcriptional regulator [Frankia nepalensis]
MSAETIEHRPTGWELRRERVSRHLERTALTLFANERPQDVTVERIAAAAGISMRTFFRYFASRDEVLASLPRSLIELLCARVRARPAHESLVEAFSAAVRETDQGRDADRELLLAWGLAVHRSPETVLLALARGAVSTAAAFQKAVTARLGVGPDDARAGAYAAALCGVVSYAFERWVAHGGTDSLSDTLLDALATLPDLR